MKKLLFISVCVTMILIACNRKSNNVETSEKTSIKGHVNNPLNGKWELFKTVCCGRMSKERYVNEKDPKEYVKFDLEKMEMKKFEMGYLKEKQSLTFEGINNDPSVQQFIKIGERAPAMYYITNDTLMLSWGYMDLESKYYVKVK